MATIQWRPEVNALTTPPSWRPRFIARNVLGKADMAARMAKALPNYSEEEFRTFIDLHNQLIAESLLNGEQVTEENAVTYSLSFTGKLNSPDDPLPPLDECLQVRIHASQPFIEAIRRDAKTERLPEEKKLPLISTVQDTVLELKDVLNPAGLLQLTGADLHFDRKQGSGCVIEGTAGGKITQTRFGKIEDSEIIVMPDLPAPPHPWNNEYTVSVSTRYSEHGTLRTGTYGRMLRSPLTLTKMGHPNPPEVGILTGKEASAHVSVTSGSVAADTTLRIQAVFDARTDALLFSLLDMKEGGAVGAAVSVTANGAVTLQGFSGSAVSSLSIRVNEYAGLKEMIRNNYGGRVVDVLKVETA
ncbi:MAG: hypothetical protein CDV28_11014 [Candidatus Electronema aureum]|uniref:Uncharacterized protein n=1 Tax=Candidatus Electronema aureum TaxID=2005002 RepID=A0A521G298_9BACT|nr:MAG: hypothetical protein CDV28_11014 [Candidatus Electronema aureum]